MSNVSIDAHRAPDPAPADDTQPDSTPDTGQERRHGPVHPVPQDDPVPDPHPS